MCSDGTGSKFWFRNTRGKVKSDLYNRFELQYAMGHFLGHPVDHHHYNDCLLKKSQGQFVPSGNCLCSHKFGHVIVFKFPSSLSSSHYQANVLNLLSQSPSLSSSSSSSPGRCSLPSSWQGSWFESGSGQEGVLIDGTSISHKVTLWWWWRPCWWKNWTIF